MRKKTDLQAVKAVAKKLLDYPIIDTKFAPMIVSHPFTNSGIELIEDDNGLKQGILKEDADLLKKWKENKLKWIDEAESAINLLCMLNKPYYFEFLKYVKPYLNIQDLSAILRESWVQVEYSNSNQGLSPGQLVVLFKEAEKTLLMYEEEVEIFDSLPSDVEIFRGVTTQNATNIKVLSWTLDKSVAEWFATRYEGKGKIYSATIKKDKILCFFSGRNESEIVVDPDFLEKIKVYKEF